MRFTKNNTQHEQENIQNNCVLDNIISIRLKSIKYNRQAYYYVII